jgi:hypothetical protein
VRDEGSYLKCSYPLIQAPCCSFLQKLFYTGKPVIVSICGLSEKKFPNFPNAIIKFFQIPRERNMLIDLGGDWR